MMKLVDAEALRVELGKCYVTRFEGKLPDGRICHYSDVLDLVSSFPAADQALHGQWIPDDYGYYRCDQCSFEHDSPECVIPYCPNCGACMECGGRRMNVVHNANCIDALREYPDRYFDLIIADPPYFSGPEKRGYYGSKVSKIGVHREYPVSSEWRIPTAADFREIFRVAKYYIIFGANYFSDTQFATGRIIWDKVNGKSSFSDAEIAATNLFKSVRIFRFMWNGMMQGRSCDDGTKAQGNKKLNEKRIHPTQKPVALYRWIFRNYVKPQWKVCDPFLGSGSSRIAASEFEIDFVGFELDAYYFAAQERRYQQEVN